MADCNQYEAYCAVKTGIGHFVSGVAQDALQNLVNNIMPAVGHAFAALGSIWILVPTPNLTGGGSTDKNNSAAGAGGAEGFTTILQWVVWIALAICILSLIAAGALLAANRRRGDGQGHVGRLGIVLGAVILISAASSLVAALLPSMGSSNASSPVGYIQDSLWWYVAGFAVLSIILAGLRMAWTQRVQPGKDLLQSLFTLIVVSSAGLVGISLAVAAADGFSLWILAGANNADFSTNITLMLSLTATSPIGLIALLIMGNLALLFSYIQIILMVIRGAMLVLLAGIFPISASFTNTETGRAWFKKCSGWLIAFILYKPAAAIIYAAAFKLTATHVFQDDGSGLVKILTGLALMVMALVALPALMRFVAPMVSQVGGGGGAALALAGAAAGAGAEVATGAIKKANSGGGMGGGGGGDSSPSTSPTGSSNRGGKPAPTSAPTTAATKGAATGAGAGGGAAAAGGGAAAAAGPVGMGLVAAQKAGEAGKKAADALKGATESAAAGGPTGN